MDTTEREDIARISMNVKATAFINAKEHLLART
jgi:hypothetical protein